MDISVILDDAKPRDIVYVGTQWVQQGSLSQLFNNTLTVCHTEIHNTTDPPSFTFYFYGSDINIYGPLTSGIGLNYTIDSTSIRPGIINSNEVGKGNINIWNLQGLDNTVYHTLQVLPTGGLFSIDYLTYTPNKYTGLAGRNLILDDADRSLQYSGNWTKTTGDYPAGVPYKGTVTGGTAKGSTMKLDFVGASISVYGLLNQQDGKLSASFSVDGGSPVTYAPFNGTQAVNASSWTLSQQFFHQDLVPGNHSLLVSLDEVTGSQALWIDSIVFEGTSSTPLNQTSTGSSSTTNSSSSLSSSAIGGIIGGVLVLAIILYRLRGKVQGMMSKPARSNSADVEQSPPAPPMAQGPPFRYPTQPPQPMMNPGYHNPNMAPPSMPYFPAPAPLSPPQAQEYPPAPVNYANSPAQRPLLPQGYSSSQLSFTDSPLPSHPHIPHQHTSTSTSQGTQQSHSPQAAPLVQSDSKSRLISLTYEPNSGVGSSSAQASHTPGPRDPIDEPPPYEDGV